MPKAAPELPYAVYAPDVATRLLQQPAALPSYLAPLGLPHGQATQPQQVALPPALPNSNYAPQPSSHAASPPWRADDKDGHYVFELGDNLTPRCKSFKFVGSQTPALTSLVSSGAVVARERVPLSCLQCLWRSVQSCLYRLRPFLSTVLVCLRFDVRPQIKS